jgi:hypothetical protein
MSDFSVQTCVIPYSGGPYLQSDLVLPRRRDTQRHLRLTTFRSTRRIELNTTATVFRITNAGILEHMPRDFLQILATTTPPPRPPLALVRAQHDEQLLKLDALVELIQAFYSSDDRMPRCTHLAGPA